MRIDLSWADLIGGRLALDFVNTKGDRLTDAPNEHLLDYATLPRLGAPRRRRRRCPPPAASAHKAAASPESAASALAEAHRRSARRIYRMLTERQRAPSAADVTRRQRGASLAPPPIRTSTFHDEPLRNRLALQSDELTAPLDAIVRDAVHLLAAPDDVGARPQLRIRLAAAAGSSSTPPRAAPAAGAT